MSSKPLDIAVIGGSLAALMSAIPLVRLGHNVTILERNPTALLHNQGAGVVVGDATQEFYRKHDRQQRAMTVTSKQRLYLNRQGRVIDCEKSVQKMTSWDLLYYLARANFDGVTSEYLEGKGVPKRQKGEGEAKYEYGRFVTSVEEVGDKVRVTFDDTRHKKRTDAETRVDDVGTGSMTVDYIVAADGPSSRMRQILLPQAAKRSYAGYVAFRGTVPEAEISTDAADVFVEKFTFFHSRGTQILAYTIPGTAGTLEAGKRLVNWVWYWNYPEEEKELEELMTDIDGNRHRFTLPTGGKMSPHVWEKQTQRAKDHLPPQFAEIVCKTKTPFAQAVTDLPPPEKGTKVGRLFNGKAALVGDALAGFRPHTAASTSQAAYHALLLELAFKQDITWDEYEEDVLLFSAEWQRRGVMLGTRSQFGHHPLEGDRVQMAPAQSIDRKELNMRK